MFDYVKCEYPLPIEGLENAEFQTKDTPEQYLETYRITKAGRLLQPIVRREVVPEDERPNCIGKPPEERTEVDKFIGAMRVIVEREEDMNYHGDLDFYGGRTNDEFYEFVARFTEGQLQWIKQINSDD